MGFVFREQINPTTVGPFMFKDWAHNNTPGKKGFQTGVNASGERVVSKPWRDPPPALGVAGQTRRLGHSTADAFGTNTEMGRIGEQAFIDIAGGHLLHPEGRGELSPLDVRIDGYGFEVKSSSTLATGYKASPKPFEINEKRAFAKQIGVKPAMAIVVLDAAKGQAHAYWRPSLATGRLSRATGWRYLGSTLLPAQTASELFKEWAHNNVPGQKGFQPRTTVAEQAALDAEQALNQRVIPQGTPSGAWDPGSQEIRESIVAAFEKGGVADGYTRLHGGTPDTVVVAYEHKLLDGAITKRGFVYYDPAGDASAIVHISTFPHSAKPGYGLVTEVTVMPSKRGRGYGTRMYDYIQDHHLADMYETIGRSQSFTMVGRQFAISWLQHRLQVEGDRRDGFAAAEPSEWTAQRALEHVLNAPISDDGFDVPEGFKEWAHNNAPGKKGFQPREQTALDQVAEAQARVNAQGEAMPSEWYDPNDDTIDEVLSDADSGELVYQDEDLLVTRVTSLQGSPTAFDETLVFNYLDIGVMIANRSDDYDRPGHPPVWAVDMVAVKQSYRHMGTASSMYDHIQDYSGFNLYKTIGESYAFTTAGRRFAVRWLEHRLELEQDRASGMIGLTETVEWTAQLALEHVRNAPTRPDGMGSPEGESLEELFKEWAHNNVPGKKGFQSTNAARASATAATWDLYAEGTAAGAFGDGVNEIGYVYTSDGRKLSLNVDNTPIGSGGVGLSIDHLAEADLMNSVVVHTHPGDGLSSFSPHDVATLIASGGSEVRAITGDHVFVATNPHPGKRDDAAGWRVYRKIDRDLDTFRYVVQNFNLTPNRGETMAQCVDRLWHQSITVSLQQLHIPYRAYTIRDRGWELPEMPKP